MLIKYQRNNFITIDLLRKCNFAEVSKNLTGCRFKNNFVGLEVIM